MQIYAPVSTLTPIPTPIPALTPAPPSMFTVLNDNILPASCSSGRLCETPCDNY